MSTYGNMARGIYLTDNMLVDWTKIIKSDGTCPIDYIVADGGSATNWSKKFADWAQVAANLNIPIVMRYQILGGGGNEYNMGDFEKGFPIPAEDLQIVALRRNLNGHTVQAIMLDFTDNTLNNGVKVITIPEGNFGNLIKWFNQNVYNLTNKAMYTYMSNQVLLDSYAGSTPGLDLVLSNDGLGMSSYKSAGLASTLTMQSWDAFPMPGDTYAPQYVGNNPSVYLCKFASTTMAFPGITDLNGNPIAVPLFLFHHDKAGFYKEVGFTPKAVTTTPTTTSGSSTSTSGSSTSTSGSSASTDPTSEEAELNAILVILTKIYNLISGFFGKFSG